MGLLPAKPRASPFRTKAKSCTMTSTALALHGSHGIDTEKPHVEVYQCQCLEYIMLFVADKTHVTATNNMKENTKERIEYCITIVWESLLALFHLLATSCDPLYNYLLEILSWHCFISWRRHESAPFIFTAILCFMFLLFLYLYLYLYFFLFESLL